MFRFSTAGESHGRGLIGILEGLPAGLSLDLGEVNHQLRRRQLGYGRGGRMKIEKDTLEVISGIRHGKSMGSPISFLIRNRDWERWQDAMSEAPVPDGTDLQLVTRPRPGHADLAGALKFHTHDARNVLERASARETAVRVAVGAFCRLFLADFGIRIGSHVIRIGPVSVAPEFECAARESILEQDPESATRCLDPGAARQMVAAIDQARKVGDTLGGIVEVLAADVPPGLGSPSHWDRKLDGLIAQGLMSIPAVKAVEIGSGVRCAGLSGSEVHDEIDYDRAVHRFVRPTNRAGGIEAGISNGAEIRARIYLKPIPTLRKPLKSVDLVSKAASAAAFERSDSCVVPAASVIAEAMLTICLTGPFLEKFGGDSMAETRLNFDSYQRLLDAF